MSIEDRDQDQNCKLMSCPHYDDGACDTNCTLGECALSDQEYRVEVERSEAISYHEARLHDDRTSTIRSI